MVEEMEAKSEVSTLDRRYLYQMPNTGKTSSTSLTVRQLCRMFSPPNASSATGDENVIPPSRFSTESQLLALLEDGVTYDPLGWKPAKDIPVIRHAACPAFYYTIHEPEKTSKGPASCRQLSEAKIDVQKDQVYGASTENQWVLSNSLPDLMQALEAFHDQPVASKMTPNGAPQSTATQDYDVSLMIFDDDQDKVETGVEVDGKESEVQDELAAFLTATDGMGPKGLVSANPGGVTANDDEDDEEEDEGYESDGGTKYARDPRTGNWVHHSLVPKRVKPAKSAQPPPNKKAKTQHTKNNKNNNSDNTKKKGPKKTKFKAKNAKCWIYVTGLPPDTSEDEVAKFFAKVGIIDLDPETQRPKVKLYRHNAETQDETTGATLPAGSCKGDASIGYARPESVELALQVLDDAPFRDGLLGRTKDDDSKFKTYKVIVQRAKFEQHGEYAQQKDKKKRISQAQRKVARLAAKQAVDWDEGEFNGRLTGGVKGLRIIVLKQMFHPLELEGDGGENEKDTITLLAELEAKVRSTCGEFGNVEKITVFSKNKQGVVVVKLTQPGAASDAVKAWDGQMFTLVKQERKVEAIFWDGVEDFTVRDEAKENADMEKRHDAFGDWLEGQAEEELPEELRLKVEN